MITISVLVPAYNEERTILTILERIAAQKVEGVSLEVLVVDDGSTDGTVALLEGRPELYAKLVRMPQNGGKGAAVRAGLKAASGRFVLFQDADLEYDPRDYHRLCRPVVEHAAEIVMGSRLVAPEYTRVHYFWHKVGNRFITFLFNVLYNTTFTDIYSCYLLYRRDLVDPDHLRSDGWEQHAEILCKATKAARVLYETPINYHGRTYDEGKKIRPIHTVAVIAMILTERFR